MAPTRIVPRSKKQKLQETTTKHCYYVLLPISSQLLTTDVSKLQRNKNDVLIIFPCSLVLSVGILSSKKQGYVYMLS